MFMCWAQNSDVAKWETTLHCGLSGHLKVDLCCPVFWSLVLTRSKYVNDIGAVINDHKLSQRVFSKITPVGHLLCCSTASIQ